MPKSAAGKDAYLVMCLLQLQHSKSIQNLKETMYYKAAKVIKDCHLGAFCKHITTLLSKQIYE